MPLQSEAKVSHQLMSVHLGSRGEVQVVVKVVSASAGVNQAVEEDPVGQDDFGSK